MKTAVGLLLAALGIGALCLLAQGPLPGDVAITRGLQRMAGEAPAWARLLTDTAKAPLLWGTLSISILLAYLRGGWSSARVGPIALLAGYGVDALLRAVLFAPRPVAELVAVATPGAGSGLPSTFALVYGSLFGAVLFASRKGGVVATLSAASSAALIAAGASARVVLAGHWTSQFLASLLLAFSIVVALPPVLEQIERARRKRSASS
jgi:hypothetical protein